MQIGIGAMPEVVCSRLADRRDLGVHSEMISDAVMDLVRGRRDHRRTKDAAPGQDHRDLHHGLTAAL